jgi:hypothetical protein
VSRANSLVRKSNETVLLGHNHVKVDIGRPFRVLQEVSTQDEHNDYALFTEVLLSDVKCLESVCCYYFRSLYRMLQNVLRRIRPGLHGAGRRQR